MKKICTLTLMTIFIVSCSGFKDAAKVLKNEKVRTTDEFLVKKKNPLQLPPNFDEIPEPDSIIKKEKDNDENKIKKILKLPSDDKNLTSQDSTIEKSILREIQK